MANIRKGANEALVRFAVDARKQHMTYGQLQQKETLELIKREKGKQKGGITNGCKEISSTGQ